MLNRLRQRAGDEGGFTLIELLVVILIIGILAAIAIPAFLNQRGKAYDSTAKSQVKTLQTAEDLMRSVVDADSAARRFSATRDPDAAGKFDQIRQEIPRRLETFVRVLQEERRADEADGVRRGTAAALDSLDALVAAVKQGAAADTRLAETSREEVDRLRERVRKVRSAETDRLNARIDADDRSGRLVRNVAIGMTGVSTALLMLILSVIVFLARPGVWR